MAGPASIILAGVAAVGALTSAGMSFGSASKARKQEAEAKARSAKLLQEAKLNLQKNYFEGLNPALDAYENQANENTLSQVMSVQALAEGDPRNLAAGIGAVGQVASKAAETNRVGLAKELYTNRKMKAEAKDDINQELISMGLGQSKQAAQESQDAKENANAALVAGVSSIGQAAATMSDASKTFGSGKQSTAIKAIATDAATNSTFSDDFSENDIASFLKNSVSSDDLYAYQENPQNYNFTVVNGELVFTKN